MSYPFVVADSHFTAGGMREPRAIAWHMAEGGGTVAWLSRTDGAQGNNSSHFVIEYDGDIVQMVREGDASWSLHVSRPYGPPGPGDFGIFSLDVARLLLGDGISDPNRYIFAVELEGYAAKGPNAAQAASMAVLASDLRARHPTIRGNLGHRDFQNYKACPGGLIPWAAVGGHGLATAPQPGGGDDVDPTYDLPVAICDITPTTLYRDTNATDVVATGWQAEAVGLYSRPDAAASIKTSAIRVDNGSAATGHDYQVWWVPDSAVTKVRLPGAPAGDCAAQVEAATSPLLRRIADAKAALG